MINCQLLLKGVDIDSSGVATVIVRACRNAVCDRALVAVLSGGTNGKSFIVHQCDGATEAIALTVV